MRFHPWRYPTPAPATTRAPADLFDTVGDPDTPDNS
jgi:hypothetical protein